MIIFLGLTLSTLIAIADDSNWKFDTYIHGVQVYKVSSQNP